ncbi:MAG: flagellar hook-length control protein FliK [Paracoccaceae bacterium]|nr:flagellar hook-length control protein FliK [Paracoccaceae bacterium]
MSTAPITQDVFNAIPPPRKGGSAASGATGFLRLMARPGPEDARPSHAQVVPRNGKNDEDDRRDAAGLPAISPLAFPPASSARAAAGKIDSSQGAMANDGSGPSIRLAAGGTSASDDLKPGKTSGRQAARGDEPAAGAERRDPPKAAGQPLAQLPQRPGVAVGTAPAVDPSPDKRSGPPPLRDVAGGETGNAAVSAGMTVVSQRDQVVTGGQSGAAQAVLAAFVRQNPVPAPAMPSSHREPEEWRTSGLGAARKSSLAAAAGNVNAEQPMSNLPATSKKGGDGDDSDPALSFSGRTASPQPNSPAAAPASAPTQAATPADMAGQAAGQMAASARGRGAQGTAELLLDPEELGKVRMTFRHHDGIVAVSISAERPDTLHLLRSHIGLLAQEFTASGFAGARFSFDGDTRSDRQSSPRADGGGAEPAPAALARPPPTALGNGVMAGATLDLRM